MEAGTNDRITKIRIKKRIKVVGKVDNEKEGGGSESNQKTKTLNDELKDLGLPSVEEDAISTKVDEELIHKIEKLLNENFFPSLTEQEQYVNILLQELTKTFS